MHLNIFQWQSLKTRVTLLTLAIVIASIWVPHFYINRVLYEDLQSHLGDQQLSTVSFVAGEIDRELEERVHALETVARSIDQAMLRNPPALQRMLAQNPVFQGHFNAGILALSLDGIAVADVPVAARGKGVNYADNEASRIALTEGKSAISGPLMGQEPRQPVFNIAAPIRDAHGKVIGALVGVINLAQPSFLDSIQEHRYGKSGGYLIVDPKHKLFVTATDKTRVMQPVPAPGVNPLFDKRMRGEYGPEVAVSSLGVENLSSAARISAADWFAIAALPTEEAFAPIRDMQRRLWLAALILTLLAGGLTWWMLRRQLSPMLAVAKTLVTLSNKSQPLQPLPITRQDEVGELIGGFNRPLEIAGEREGALRERDERFQALFDRASDGIMILSLSGSVVAVNESFARMHGYTREEMQTLSLKDLDTPEAFRMVPERMQRILAGESILFKVEHYHKDGHVLSLEVSSSLIPSDSEPLVQAFHRDITERKQAEEALARESYRSEVFLRNASDGVHILDADGNVLEVSDSFCAMLGYSRQDLLGANVSLWDAQWSPQELRQKIAEKMANKDPSVFETRHRRRDGSIAEVEISSHGLELDGNRVLFNSARDITERKRAEAYIRESETKYRLLFETANDGIFLLDACGFLDCNQKGAQMYGRPKKDLIGRSPESLSPPRQPGGRLSSEIAAEYMQAAFRGETPMFEWQSLRADGVPFEVEIRLNRIEIGGSACLQAIVRDVTERRRMEEAHVQAQKLESLGTLAGGIAHDFNNILAAIRGNVDLAAHDVGPDHAAAQSLEEIRKAGVRATELVRRIMAFGRPKEARQQILDLGAVVHEVLKLLRSTLPASVVLKNEINQNTPRVQADAGQIHEAIVNLTTNAAYAIGPRAGSIEYRLEPIDVDEKLAQSIPGLQAGRYARLTVTDSGCGMDAATRERVFDAFYTTKPTDKGTGLGLSMVHGTMRSHGGAVTVESALGKGSSFALYFPAARQTAQTEEQGTTVQQPQVTGQRVLYVDDEEALVLLARRMLSRLGHQASGFADPKAALAAFRSRPQDFDVVVTDLSMPHMSGLDFAREALALRPGIPVLLTSGNIREEDARLANEMGIREVLLKPVTGKELGRAIDRLFRDAAELTGKPPE